MPTYLEIKSLEFLNSNGSITAILDVQKTLQMDSEITAGNDSKPSAKVSGENNSWCLTETSLSRTSHLIVAMFELAFGFEADA